MQTHSIEVLVVVSRALERALVSLRGKPRLDINTSDLADGVLRAVEEGCREEVELAERALDYVTQLATSCC
jgi:hypothetical protein